MPARDGTGPMGRGTRTGRGMGNCGSLSGDANQTANTGLNQTFRWGSRIWNSTVGRIFGRRRGNRFNRN